MNKQSRSNDAVGLSYEPRHDVFNNLRPLSQYEMDWVPTDKFVVESYKKRKCRIEIDVGIDVSFAQYRLIFLHVPEGGVNGKPVAGRIEYPTGMYGAGLHADPKGQLMFIGAGNPPYVSQAIVAADVPIPSWVWLETAKDIVEFGRDIFALPRRFSAQNTVKVGRVHSERKVGLLAGSFPMRSRVDALCAMQTGLVESVSQALESIRSDAAQLPRERLLQDKLVNLLHGIRIEINDNGIYRLVVGEGVASIPKVLSFRLSPID